MKKYKREIIVGLTKDNEILKLAIKNPKRKGDYFSISGDTSKPITRSKAKKQTKDFWEDYFGEEEIQEMNQRMGTRFRSPKQAGKYVREVDGELHGFDNSLMPEEVRYKNKDWLFESGSAGQIRGELDNLKVSFVKKKVLNKLKKQWDSDHLKSGRRFDLRTLPKQDTNKQLKKSIRLMMQK